MRRIKLCHIIDGSDYNPLLYNSIKFSNREIFEYTVISLLPAGKLQEQMKELSVNSFSLNCHSRKQYPATIWSLFRYFVQKRFDIVQVHLFEASVVGLHAAYLAHIPVRIFSGHHSNEIILYKNKKLTFADSFLSKRLANKVISPSNQMKEIFMEAEGIPTKSIEVIPHGIDLKDWQLAAKNCSKIKTEINIKDKIVFGAVGRLFWIKDFETLIIAFTKVAEKRDDLILLIAGDGTDKESLQNLITSLNMQNKIHLLGRRSDIASVMLTFDIFVHSSLAESFGLVFIEALALGKPIISTKVGVAPDIIKNGDNGFLVSTKNPEELSNAMMEVLERKPDWRRMGKTNEKISENFAIQKTQTLCDNNYLKWFKKNE